MVANLEYKNNTANYFTDTEKRETPLYIWQTDRSYIALVHWYDSAEDIVKYYIKAVPVI